ncbi:FRAS1-related extracellular matrix protein 1b isoform X3 [Parambassis ranga]|uniref:FRAS1-related extracellular matrix protein 1b isoform X3 n=1 Tax=Parambassis ranga TaxID=210632 RepID=A0A6P7HLT8_9TELE|nr:FRAS1-related extracellular matrix protein 1-like isoform X3 [Parambassis ranga]
MAATRLLLLLLLLLAVTAVCSRTLVLVNSGVEVTRGHAVYITEKELRISVEPTADCKVEVVMNEPMTQRVGRLTPQVFDCSFLQDEVKYVHNGSPLLDEDAVMLRVYRFTSSDTQVETVVLVVRVVDSGSSVVELGSTPLVVPEFYGLSNPINGSVLNIRTTPDLVCTVRLMTTDISVPAVGRLVREEESTQRKGASVCSEQWNIKLHSVMSVCSPSGRQAAAALCPGNKPCLHDTKEVRFLKTSCQDFLSSDLKYQHLSPPSPEIDYVPIRVELRQRASRALLESQAVWLPVLIHGAMQNQPPRAAFMASFILEVDQFILTPLTTAALDAKDQETPQERLIFNVTAPPAEGYVTHLDDHTKPIQSFTWLDLHEMQVAYQPPNGSRSHRRNYEVEFQAVDGSYTSSPPITVHISIRASETTSPRVSWNMGLDLLEGQSRPITWEQLQIVDNDNINAVYLVAVDGPLHGRLSVRGGKAFMFRVKDLREGVVVYHHSDSDSTRDHIVFRISDGRHSIRHKFPINILPKDDSPPFLITNVAVEVQEGGAVRLEEYMLLASDLDSSDDYILYQMVTAPRAGQLLRRSSPQEAGHPVDSFLQRDLIQGQIYYQHSGEEQFEDSFDFTLSDSHQPPNLSQTYTVVIHVFPVKDQLPVEAPGSTRSLAVKETDVVYITQSHLHFTDREHPDSDLTYVITQPCFSPLHPGLMDAGRLFYTDSSTAMKRDHMVPVLKSFTQHAVNHMKVAFMPPVEDIGPDPLFVQFVFSVTDHHGGTAIGLIFNITITPVDDQTPEAFTNLLRVEEGGAAFVTEEHLLVQDRDSREGALRVELQRVARHGRLELQGRTLLQGDGFTLPDLRGLRLRYIHDDSETTEDEVALKVTDGLNSADVVLHVQVLPMNDEPPQLGGGLRGELACQEGGRVQVTVDYLSATDQDSDDSRLTYMLARSPARGELQRAGLTVDKFSQQDLLQGHMYYVHTGGEIGPDPVFDTVTLIISDGEAGGTDGCCHGDTPPPPVPLHGTLPVYDLNITVLPVNNKVPSVTVGASMLAVDEGSASCLCGGVLGASDPDSPPEQLTFHLETPPLHGFLENTLPAPGSEKSNAGVRVESFSLVHLTSGFINYVQSEHRGAEPTVDQLTISVSDGLHHSAPVPFYIIINPINDETPSLLLANFSVKEGGTRELTPSLLDGFDLDAPADLLTFTVKQPPAHGRLAIFSSEMSHYKEMEADLLRRSLPVTSFTLQELRQGMKIVYMHDDTETLKDAVALRLTDGVHTVEGTAQVTVLPVNDEKPRLLNFVVSNGDSSRSGVLHFSIERGDRIPPTLSRNTGLRLQDGSTATITADQLQLTDPDTAIANLSYIITQPPLYGKLLLRGALLSSPPRFSQTDVDELNLVYRHNPGSPAESDKFYFLPSDGHNQGYLESGQLRGEPAVFNIQVERVDRTPPSLTTMQSPSTVVDLGSGRYGIFITNKHLQASDPDSPTEELEFSISRPPHFGYLENTGTGAYISGRFTQRDVDQRSVLFVVPADMEVTSDSFRFRLSDPAGNAALPRELELSWSRVELSATCYRTCETAGMLQIQIQRSGRSIDPAYVSIQVEEESAKLGRDFTHSAAGLLQFDPGVTVKTWNVYLIDDGLEENHETFTVTLKNPQNAVLGQRTSASVEIIDPRQGRCDPDDLKVEDNQPAPPQLPAPPQVEEDPVTDIEAELLWENQPQPPRGDVPNRQLYLDYRDGEPQDQASPSYRHISPHSQLLPTTHAARTGPGLRGGPQVCVSGERRTEEKVWTFHSLTPLRLEELQPSDAGWRPQAHGHLLQEELPDVDLPHMDRPESGHQPELRQRKMGQLLSSSCANGWTHYKRRCYIVSSSVASWGSADRTCSLLFNSSLTSVHSRRDMSWLWRFAGRKPFWIGLSGGPSQWTWADGQPFSFSRLRGAPSGHSESDLDSDCVLVESPRNWISTSCSAETQHAFICSSPSH